MKSSQLNLLNEDFVVKIQLLLSQLIVCELAKEKNKKKRETNMTPVLKPVTFGILLEMFTSEIHLEMFSFGIFLHVTCQ